MNAHKTSRAPTRQVVLGEKHQLCAAFLKQVRKTGEAIRVTRFGKAVAEVFPPLRVINQADWLGSMVDDMEIVGDVVSPVALKS